MTNYFECLHCGTFTRVMAGTPLCRECGCGTGFLRSLSPEEVPDPYSSARVVKDDPERQPMP